MSTTTGDHPTAPKATLPPMVTRNLGDRYANLVEPENQLMLFFRCHYSSYEKRKQAALEIEQLVKDLNAGLAFCALVPENSA